MIKRFLLVMFINSIAGTIINVIIDVPTMVMVSVLGAGLFGALYVIWG